MKKSRLALFAALLLALMLLCGCSFKNATLDAQMQAVVTALNAGDGEAVYQMFHPGVVAPEAEFMESIAPFIENWQQTDMENVRLVGINVQTRKNTSSSYTVYEGTYKLGWEDLPVYLELVYLKEDGAAGITSLHLGEMEETSGVEISAVSIFNLAFYVIFVAAAIITIVDVIRKKPRRYGWYIVLALVHLNLRVNGLEATLPLGAIIYWCVRKKLLAAKAARLAAATGTEESGTDAE